ncbi:MAG: class I SAM-dependent methyltransferase [Deltaproteobacteria bacterium]|nr:class I SAM-dependent methyltransferase [Deltaproteobacteria bacterium]
MAFHAWLLAQLDRKGWPTDVAFDTAKRELEGTGWSTVGCTRRTLEEHRRGRRRSVKHPPVRYAALAWQEDPEAVATEVGFPPPTWQDQDRFLFDRTAVFDEQANLAQGDQVVIITCRALLEMEVQDVRRLVVENLGKGVIYRYYYPRPTREGGRPNDAERSYVEFKRSLEDAEFDVPPQIYGFGVDSKQFEYFSKLHTLVHYIRASPGTAWAEKMYNFIECAVGDRGEPYRERRWYKILPDNVQDIKSQLSTARDAVADSGLGSHYSALNAHIRGLSEEYRRFFEQADGSKLYGRVRRTANHKRVCVDNICEKFLGKLRPRFRTGKAQVKYLDIGCGNGEITSAIAQRLRARFDEISVSAIDPSTVECDEARKRLSPLDAQVEPYRFEDAPLDEQRFHLITSVHSFYTIDEVYLRKIYDHLEPEGVACIWIGALKGNAMTQICDRIDRVTQPGQRRNYAEEIETILNNMGLTKPERMTVAPYPTQVEPLLEGKELNGLGMAVASFFAMKDPDGDVSRVAAQAALEFANFNDKKVTGHSVNDHLITFWRRSDSG